MTIYNKTDVIYNKNGHNFTIYMDTIYNKSRYNLLKKQI